MGKSDEASIKAEIDSIAENIDTILKRIDAATPSKPPVEEATDCQGESPDDGAQTYSLKPGKSGERRDGTDQKRHIQ